MADRGYRRDYHSRGVHRHPAQGQAIGVTVTRKETATGRTPEKSKEESYMAMIRGLTIALGLSAAFGLSATASAQETYIPLISKGFQHQFWQAVKQGAEQAGKDLKVKVSFEGPETEAMVDKQIDMLSAALAKKPTALGFAALDSKAAIPLLKKAQAAKIPVVAFDSGVDSDIPVTTATTDNLAAAALAADKMAELIGKSGEVALVVHAKPAAPASTGATAF